MERPCQYPGCKTTLSEFVPQEVILCGRHQYQLLKLKSILNRESLSEEDIIFIFYHQQGCNARQLAIHLDIPLPTMTGYLKRGTLKARKIGKGPFFWDIPIGEIIKAIIITRNWISVRRLVHTASICKEVLLSYVREGYFGPFQFNLSGALSIRRKEIPGLPARFQAIRSLKLKKKKWQRKYLREGEITPSVIAMRLQTCHNTVYYWMKKGQLVFQRRGKRLVVKETNFKQFARRAITGAIRVRKKFLPALQAICGKNVS